MKVTLITTVYNEESSISDLFWSVKRQEVQPDEWIIVDGGSDDFTRSRIYNLRRDYEMEECDISVVVEDGANISEGRNIAVEKASHDYIIGTDGGCELNERFVKSFKERFEEGYKALGGVYKYQADSVMEQVQGIIRTKHHSPEKVSRDDNHPPSHRAVAYHRDVWKEVGGYREDLYTGEDSRFNSDVQDAGYMWRAVPGAIAYWKMRPTYSDYWKQFELYGQGDCRAGTMFDYHGGLFGVSKVFLMTGATWLGLIGLTLSIINPVTLLLSVAGFGMPYGYYLPHLKESVEEVGVKAIPIWGLLVAIQVFAHFTGYYKEWVRTFIRQ